MAEAALENIIIDIRGRDWDRMKGGQGREGTLNSRRLIRYYVVGDQGGNH